MSENPLTNKSLWWGVGGGAGMVALFGVFMLGAAYGPRFQSSSSVASSDPSPEIASVTVADPNVAQLAEVVTPSAGITLPVTWGNLGKQLVEKGVIDRDQFVAVYSNRLGGLGPNELKMLDGNDVGDMVMTQENAGVLLNLLWALGLGNKNVILETGPMVNPQYGGAENFASTSGWSLAKGKTMDHYSKHAFIQLTKDQQATVERVSKNIYRPCCNNSTYFPDCNHGMAMLGLLEMMASQGVSEDDMYKAALQVNSYWFPDTYLTLAKYEAKNNVSWKDVNPKNMLSAEYSSAGGYRAIRSQVQPVQQGGGNGCGV